MAGEVRIAGVGVAVPPYGMTQAEAGVFLSRNYSALLKDRSARIMERVFQHPSVRQRYFAFEDPDHLVREDPDKRIDRYTRWALSLSAEAARKALEKSGVKKEQISALVVNTCTGYICPGISTYLVEELGLQKNIQAYDLVGSGCGGAIPNLQVSSAMMNGDPENAVLSVSVEVCSATFQMDDDPSLIVSNALFADGAGACVLWRMKDGLRLVDTASLYLPEHREAIRYVYKKGQLHNQLSPGLARILMEPVAVVVGRLLEKHGLRVQDVKHWAIHPGGDKIIGAVKESLGLSEAQMAETRSMLADYGNVSSASVWFILERVLKSGVEPGDWCVMLAAGAGLSVHSYLMQV